MLLVEVALNHELFWLSLIGFCMGCATASFAKDELYDKSSQLEPNKKTTKRLKRPYFRIATLIALITIRIVAREMAFKNDVCWANPLEVLGPELHVRTLAFYIVNVREETNFTSSTYSRLIKDSWI